MKNFTQRNKFTFDSGLKRIDFAGSVILSFLLAFMVNTSMLQAQGIAFFNDPAYGDDSNDMTCNDENYTLSQTLANMGMPVTTFINNIDDFVTDLPGHNVLIISDQEEGDLDGDLDPVNRVAIQSYVASGGTVMVFNSANVINDLFGYTIGTIGGVDTNIDAATTVGTCYAEQSLVEHDATSLLVPTLPAGSVCYYKDASDNTSIASIPFGIGEIIYIGWDWLDGGPGCPLFDPAWNNTVACAITMAFPNEDCTLACNNNVQVSLDGECQAIVVADMILEDPTLDCIYGVQVKDLNDNIIPSSPLVTGDYIGETLRVSVTTADGNSCWGYIHIEDKLPPVITCLDDVTVGCNDWFDLDLTNTSYIYTDNTQATLPANSTQNLSIPVVEEFKFGGVISASLTFNFEFSASDLDASLYVHDPDGNMIGNLDIHDFDSADYPGGAVTLTFDVLDLVPTQSNDPDLQGTYLIEIYAETDDNSGVDYKSSRLEIVIGGPAVDNCSETFFEITDLELEDHDCTFDDISFKKTYFYRAFDAYGNYSEICELGVYFERRDLGDLVFPTDTIFGCSKYAVEEWDDYIKNEYPDAHHEEAGVPTVDGKPIFPNEHYCEINVTFEDQLIAICEGQYKILRKWTALDWCQPEELREEYQIIKIGDFDGILAVSCPSEQTEFPAGPYDCVGTAELAPPITEDVCSDVTYQVAFLLADEDGNPPTNAIYTPTGVIYGMDDYAVIPNLPYGRTWVKYTVTDACGNIGECFSEVDIYDDTPPYPVCDQFTAVTLTQSGWAQIFAESFDDGSHDNCTDLWFGVRRMDYTGNNHFCDNEDDLEPTHIFNGSTYYAFEQFCCLDVGNEDLMVQLLVCDEWDNCNTCMVNVDVQDKIPFQVICPPNITIDCRDDYNDLTLTGYPGEVIDNCGSATPTYSDDIDIDNCGVGTILRKWIAQIGNQSDSCIQIITVRNLNPDYDVEGPEELVEINGCMDIDTHPDNTGYPTYNDDACSLMSSTYEDQVFYFADGACFKIVREWTVIDWCLYDDSNGLYGLWYFNQVIKVNNSVDPEFNDVCDDIDVEAFGELCDEYVDVVVVATDDCTAPIDLVYSYEIDLDSDGLIDDTGSGNNASGYYPVGEHIVYWEVEDMCGNIAKCEQIIRVRDEKNPTPYCLGGITTVVMNDPLNTTIEIWASDFDLGSYDNCDGFNINLSFTSDVADSFMLFGCEHLGLQEVQIWVTDQSGNQDYCSTMIDIQDHSDLCGTGAAQNSTVAGKILSISDEAVEGVQVSIHNMEAIGISESNTVSDGTYAFSEIGHGIDYAISAERNDNYLNGVSTLDLVLIQKHILGITSLNSAYKLIAADVNDSQSVSAADLVEIRKLILGIYTELPNNDSWRFVDASASFGSDSQPWPFEEVITVQNLNHDMMNNNFVGIKVGDVNNSAVSNLNGEIDVDNRSVGFTFVIKDQSFATGELVDIPVMSSERFSLNGYQFTMNLQGLEYQGFESGSIELEDANFAIHGDNLATSWHAVDPVSIDNGELLYTLKFRATNGGTISNALTLNSEVAIAEVYNSELDVLSPDLRFNSEASNENGLFVFQNEPNPFTTETNIRFDLSDESIVNFKLMDISGKILFQESVSYAAGNNSYRVDVDNLNTAGMIYYQVSTEKETITKKMLLIK